MQVKELKNEGLSYELEVTVTAKDIDKHVDARLAEYAKTLRLPGFRPGKAPMSIVKQRYGKAVMGEVLERAVNDSSAKVLNERKLRPALQPKIEVTQFDEGKDLTYKMAVEVIPDFKVMDLKDIKVEKLVAKPDKKAVDEALERIASQRRESEPVKENRAAKKGDVTIINFQGETADGTKYPGMSGNDYNLELGSNSFIAGFEDQLVGKKKGDKVKVEVTFPENYHMADLAGAAAIFNVEITDLHELKPVKIDDEFAKGLGYTSEQALRDVVEKQIKGEYDSVSRLRLKRSLLDALDDAHEFEIPAGMKELEYANIRQQIAMERQGALKGGKLELSDEEEEELHAIAERRVRLGLVLSEVGRANKIQVNDQELQRAVINEARRFPGQEAEVFEYYRKNRQALEALRAPVFEDKVVDYIMGLAQISEKEASFEDLTAEEDESYMARKKGKSGGKKKAEGSKSAEKKETARNADKDADEKPAKTATKSKKK